MGSFRENKLPWVVAGVALMALVVALIAYYDQVRERPSLDVTALYNDFVTPEDVARVKGVWRIDIVNSGLSQSENIQIDMPEIVFFRVVQNGENVQVGELVGHRLKIDMPLLSQDSLTIYGWTKEHSSIVNHGVRVRDSAGVYEVMTQVVVNENTLAEKLVRWMVIVFFSSTWGAMAVTIRSHLVWKRSMLEKIDGQLAKMKDMSEGISRHS